MISSEFDGFSIAPTFRDRLRFLALLPRDWLLHLVCSSYRSFLWGFEWLSPRYLEWSSRTRARRAYLNSFKNVPAYARFIKDTGSKGGTAPETDKDSYILKYSVEDRCVGGLLTPLQTMIDESSGSTGVPYNWVRSPRERLESQLFISYFATYCYGHEPWITLNAFSMGAWATGINMGMAMQRNSIVKNTGPDIGKLLNTLSFFGPKYRYLIVGYPPFLKHFLDVAEQEKFPLNDFTLNAMVGGEGMAEGLRDYLLRHFRSVYSGYGATDLEIGIAGETPVSVAIRRLARENESVRRAIFGEDSRLPMLFQYNPLMHYVETNARRELIFTITRSSVLSPRIRYNIHDEGGVARYDQVEKALAGFGYDIRVLSAMAGGSKRLRLPFLWVYGRRDSTISIMGANIYPEDLEHCLYAEPVLARVTRSFCLATSESASGSVVPCFHFEVEVEPSEELRRKFALHIPRHLLELNADYRAAWHEFPEAMVPEIYLHAAGEGPFKHDSGKIKQVRLLSRQ